MVERQTDGAAFRRRSDANIGAVPRGIALFLLGAALHGLSASRCVADGPVRVIRDMRIDYVRPIGLPGFEEPVESLAVLEAAARDLAAMPGAIATGVLAPLPVRLLGTNAIDASAIASPDGVAMDDPLSVAPDGLRAVGARGALASVLRAYAQRARDASVSAECEEGLRVALIRFADTLESRYESVSPLTSLSVSLVVRDGILTAGDAAEPMTLPAVATYAGIDESGIRSIATQIEATLERELIVQSPDGSGEQLEFLVRVAPPLSAADSTLRVLVAFVGPRVQPAVPVSAISISYVGGDGSMIENPSILGLPDPQQVIDATRVELVRIDDADYLSDFGEGRTEVVALGAIPEGTRLSVAALRSVAEGVLASMQERDLMGVYVDVLGGQFDMSRGGLDTRGGATDLMLVVVPGIVERTRVVATGERVEGGTAIDPPDRRYARIVERSPIRPDDPSGRVLRRSELEDFLHRQSRHPNRRVDAAVTPPPESEPDPSRVPGTIGLDYLVSENRPWTLFVQGSNTGTGSTGEWQERFGAFHSDAFGNDEILSIEYLTTDFESMHAVNGYFDAPILESDRMRWKVYAGWYDYTASDVGISGERFKGRSPSVGAELSLNVFQRGELFIDAIVGARWFDVTVDNLFINLRGEQDFLVPYLGMRVQRNTRAATTDISVIAEFSLPDATDVDSFELNALGRLFPERDWRVLRWDLSQSFYLDPFFVRDPREGTLAHEIALRFRGQYSFDERLIPQQLGVAGGLYTVRGYPESIVSGDTMLLMTGEYRLHLPQILGIDANPTPIFGMGEPFRLRPQFGYGSTDWDLILRAFVDVGRVENVDRLSFENDDTLIGAGIGVQLQILRHLDLRLDLGFPLRGLEGRDIDDHRLSFVGTIAF
jgi:hemolysin activation/secretion protein